MRLLTPLPDGSIPFDDEHPGRIDAGQVRAGGRHDRVEPALRVSRHHPCARFGAGSELRIRLDDDNLPARELQRCGVNPGETQLEHAARPLAEQVDDMGRRARGEGRRKPEHTLPPPAEPEPERILALGGLLDPLESQAGVEEGLEEVPKR